MNHSSNSDNWKQDPRLKNMDPGRLSMLMDFASRLQQAPDSQKMSAFLAISQNASKAGMHFTPDERDLLILVLTETMSPEEKAKVQMIQALAAKLQAGRK